MKAAVATLFYMQVAAVLCLGRYRAVETEDDQALVMAQYAVPLIQQHIKSDKFFAIKSIDKVNKQLVSGTNYRMVLSLVETDCAADAGQAGLDCEAVDKPSLVKCRVLVYDVPWRNHRSITKHHCTKPKPVGPQWRKQGKRAWKRRQFGKKNKQLNGKKQQLSGERLEAEFGAFVQTYGKQYGTQQEYERRRQIFADNWEHARHFQKMERGTAKYGVTKFSDLTVDEWRATSLGLDLSRGRPEPEGHFRRPAEVPDVGEMPDTWDWRKQGAVTPVKNQGQCGSCWAFSVTGNVEGQNYLKHKELVSLSEQELVDCDTDDHGCQGGLPDTAYKFIEFLGGLEQESDYPYEGHNGQCRLNRTDIKVKLTGSLDLPKDEVAIQKWLYAHGPVSIGVNANPLMFYRGGIINVWSFLCRASGIDHGVLLVGYGHHGQQRTPAGHVQEYHLFNKTMPFWIIKNSWGSDWGEQGYFRLIRGSDECGVGDMASSAVVA